MPLFQTLGFRLQSGILLPQLDVAYECYGVLNAEKSNAILVHHGTTSTHYAAGRTTPDLREGWWDSIIGSGKLLDTEKYCVISSNMLGSSYGTTGPASINPSSGRAWGGDFPHIAVEDMVRAQKLLIDSLGIEKLHAVAGGSVGGLLGVVRQMRTRLCKDSKAIPYAAPRPRHSARAAARLSLKFVRVERLRS